MDDVSISFPGGETSCLIGPSGSGKSTLLRLINLLEFPSHGEVRIGTHNIAADGFPIESVRRQIGMVFQHYSLFPQMTVLDNVAFALTEVHGLSKEAARENSLIELDRVGIRHLADRMSDQISGGERQRAAIARSLAIKPRIMLFDEVTSALDPELVRGVLGLVEEFHALGTTVVVVTHEMRFAKESSSYLAFMDQGRLVEHGSPEQLFDNPQSPRLRGFIEAIA